MLLKLLLNIGSTCGSCENPDSDSRAPWWGVSFFILNKLPGGADNADRTTLGTRE
jgi:hypothetical protein